MFKGYRLIVGLVVFIILYIFIINCNTTRHKTYKIVNKWHYMPYIEHHYLYLISEKDKWSESPVIVHVPGEYYIDLDTGNNSIYEYRVNEQQWNNLSIDSTIEFKYNTILWENQIIN